MVAEDANIKVYVRCRGVSGGPEDGKCYNTVSSKEIQRSTGASKRYQFDHVFDANSDQKMVFEECAQPLIDEFIKGYNGTLFAYGQTGTGKTYTMAGECVPPSKSERAGIVPRVLEAIFSRLEAVQDWILELKYIELYNEDLRDLLSQPAKTKDKVSSGNSKSSETKLKIIEGRNKCIEVVGATSVPVSNLNSALEIVRDATSRRQTAATRLNVDSSRSHSVLTLILVSREPVSGMAVRSKLHLVDLAGSENVAKSGAVKVRAQEAGEINKSLLSLGRVIEMLVRSGGTPKASTAPLVRDNARHSGKQSELTRSKPYVSYRDSKLTHILQDSLGGSTKTRMIATISLAPCDAEETKSTLEYASRARSIRNQIQTEVEIMDMHITLKELAKQLEDTQQELRVQRSRDGGAYLSNYNYHQLKSGQRKYAELLAQKETESRHQELRLNDARAENTALSKERDELKDRVQDLMQKRPDFELSADAGAKIKESTDVAVSALGRYTGELDRFTRELYEKVESLPQAFEDLTGKFKHLLTASRISNASQTLQRGAVETVQEHGDLLKEELIGEFDQIANSMSAALNSVLVEANKSILVVSKSMNIASAACTKLERQFDNMQADIAVQQSSSSETSKLVSMLEAHDQESDALINQLVTKRRELLEMLAAKQRQVAVPQLSNSASQAVAVLNELRNALSECTPNETGKHLEGIAAASSRHLFGNAFESLRSTVDHNLSSLIESLTRNVDSVAESCKKDFAEVERSPRPVDEMLRMVSQILQDTAAYRQSSLLSAEDMKTRVSEELRRVRETVQVSWECANPTNPRRMANLRLSPRKSPRREHDSRITNTRKAAADANMSAKRTHLAARSPLKPTTVNRLMPEVDSALPNSVEKASSAQPPARSASRTRPASTLTEVKEQWHQSQPLRKTLPPVKRRRREI